MLGGGGITGEASMPLYVRLAQLVRQDIRAGTYVPGTLLPGERLIAERYQVSPETARRALRMLRQEGTVTMKRGIGYEVQDPPKLQIVQIRPGDTVATRVSSDAERDAHGIPEGAPVLVVHRAPDGPDELYNGNDVCLQATSGPRLAV